jgi:hypothetical protein
LVADPAGNFLINEYGESCANINGLAISPVDGSLSEISTYVTAGTGICAIDGNMAIDSTGNFLYSYLGTFFVTAGNVTPDQIPPVGSLPDGPWVADPIGRYLFVANQLVYSITPGAGVLTNIPQSSPVDQNGSAVIVVTGYPS